MVKKGVDDLRHRHTTTSPAADTKIDSALDNAKEHRFAKFARISELSLLEDDVDDEELIVGTFRLLAGAFALLLLLFAASYPGVLGGNNLEWITA